MSRISLAQANTIIEAAFAKAAELKMQPLGVAVLDPGAHLIAFQRQDTAPFGRFALASGKASGALQMGRPSRKLEELGNQRPSFLASAAANAPMGMIAAAGGVLVVSDSGEVIGAVGVSGDTSDNDELAAIAGIEAAGLKVQS
jgi:uncharacterized protein GlcG (DUF336 family)